MGKVISILGAKGGSGKTTVAHLLAHGMGSLPRPVDAVVVTTDALQPFFTAPRRYGMTDGRALDNLPVIIQKLDKNERLVIIVDGAASRPDLDKLLIGVSDLLVLPYRPSYGDAERAVQDLERLPGSVAIPTAWPRHPDVEARARRFLDMLPSNRRLGPIPQLSRVDELLDPSPEAYRRIATVLSRGSRHLAISILHRMKTHPLDMASQRR